MYSQDDQGYYQNLKSKFVGTYELYPNWIMNREYTLVVLSSRYHFECFNFHKYGHIACDCRYMMGSSMKDKSNIRHKKIWRRKRKQED